jgi:hypothetical protein
VIAGLLGDSHQHLALRRELDGVRNEVDQHLPKAGRVAVEPRAERRLDRGQQLEAIRERVAGGQRACIVDDLPEVEVVHVELEHPGLDLGEVEHVGDHAQQRLPGTLRDLRVLRLLRVEIGPEQQLRHADHPVERSAQLMAHVRHELGLQPRRLDGLHVRRVQRVRRELALGDVGRDRADAARRPVVVDERELQRQQRALPAVCHHDLLLDLERLARAGDELVALAHRSGLSGREDVLDRVSHDIRGDHAEHRLEGGIDEHQAAAGVLERDDRRRVLEDRPQACLARAHAGVRLLAGEEMADLLRRGRQHAEQLRVGRRRAAVEELHHAADALRVADRDADG